MAASYLNDHRSGSCEVRPCDFYDLSYLEERGTLIGKRRLIRAWNILYAPSFMVLTIAVSELRRAIVDRSVPYDFCFPSPSLCKCSLIILLNLSERVV